jgi:hypothetical protein
MCREIKLEIPNVITLENDRFTKSTDLLSKLVKMIDLMILTDLNNKSVNWSI